MLKAEKSKSVWYTKLSEQDTSLIWSGIDSEYWKFPISEELLISTSLILVLNVFDLIYTDLQLQGLFYADSKQSYYRKFVKFSQIKHICK